VHRIAVITYYAYYVYYYEQLRVTLFHDGYRLVVGCIIPVMRRRRLVDNAVSSIPDRSSDVVRVIRREIYTWDIYIYGVRKSLKICTMNWKLPNIWYKKSMRWKQNCICLRIIRSRNINRHNMSIWIWHDNITCIYFFTTHYNVIYCNIGAFCSSGSSATIIQVDNYNLNNIL